MKRTAGGRSTLVIVALLGLLALGQHWAAQRRPESAWLRPGVDLVVTSAEDSGPGSLREAIFAADSARQRARIRLQVSEIVLQSPLPPLINPQGVIIEARGPVVINAGGIGAGPVFDISAPNSSITGVTITQAPQQAILARASGLRLQNVELQKCDVGVYLSEGVGDLAMEASRFRGNRIGVWLAAENSGVMLQNSEFFDQADAAIWAVSRPLVEVPEASTLRIASNHFEGDRLSVVVANVGALIENNQFIAAREAAVYVIGKGAVVRGNRIRSGARIGIFAHETQGTVIVNNEIDHNQALAMMIRSSRDAVLQNNRVYSNGYGIAFVLGAAGRPNVASDNALFGQQFDGIILVGESPMLRKNEMLNNQQAGLRILDFLPPDGARVASEPFLAENTLRGNGANDPVRGEYRVRRPQP
jgi:hypothetical protein